MDSFSRLCLLYEVIIALGTCVSFVVLTDQFRGWNRCDCLTQDSFCWKQNVNIRTAGRARNFEDFILWAIEYAARDFALIQRPPHALPICYFNLSLSSNLSFYRLYSKSNLSFVCVVFG